MHILIINHYAGSPKYGMEFRPYYLAKEFRKMGHTISIIGASYSHLRRLQPIVKGEFSKDDIDNISFYWIKTPKYYGNGKRIINILFFVSKLVFYNKKISKMISPDIVIASSTYPLDIYPARKIAKNCKAKLCFEVHDLWPLSPMVIGNYSKYHPYIYIFQIAENYAYRHCDLAISLLGNAEVHMVNHGLDPGKFVHIPNGFDREEFEIMTDDVPRDYLKIINDLQNTGKILIGYAGGHGPSNAMHVFVNAARMFQENFELFFISVGDGPSKNDLQFKAKDLKNVLFLPSIPKKSIPKLLALFDILYVGFVKSEIHKYGISPNKLIDYMLAAKPIILSADVKNEVVDKCNCGLVVPAEDPVEVYNAINKIIALTDKERIEMGERGKKFVLHNFDYQNLAVIYINRIIALAKIEQDIL